MRAPDALDNPPFLLRDDWSELPAAHAPFSDADAPDVINTLEAKRQNVLAWWRASKRGSSAA